MSEARQLRLVIAGGGTGGHVFPALALGEHVLGSLAGSEVLFVGSRGGLEERLVPARGHRLELLEVGKLRGEGALARARTLASLPAAVIAAVRVLRRFAPDVVVGVGGYASGPTILAATVLRLPVVLLEQNSIPGTTNRAIARLARRVVIGFRRAARYLPADRTVLLGNPIRPEVLAALQARPERRASGAPCLLVLGGSQGAHAINELMANAAGRLRQQLGELRLVHQTGPSDLERTRESYAAAGVAARVEAFIDDVGPALRDADLVLSRAGATTLAELCVAGLPAVLVPYPYAADDHQAANAAELVEAGGAVMVRQGEIDAERLATLLAELLGDEARRQHMAEAMRRCGYPEAAAAVTSLLLELVRRA
jgi:UDP-N-acetylglucosamine--N-acetylmuramyl-(pentapeptide) pyrophosphoryl-undecaprenol N-acetylglucosamine transferase